MNKKSTSNKSRTDFSRLDKMKDTEIDFSDTPEIAAEKFAKAVVRKGLKPTSSKTQVTIRIDSDVLEWFKGTGKGYQTHINMLLRAYMREKQNSSQSKTA